MKRTEIESTGIVGINVTLNHSELVAIKDVVAQINSLEEVDKYDFAKQGKPLLKAMGVFLSKILPDHVMSIEEAHAELFTIPVVETPANNEL